MIVLDTNVVCDATRPSASHAVAAWLRRQPTRQLFTTTVTEAELWFGIELLPDGKRRRELAHWTGRAMQEFAGRVLPFDRPAARAYGKVLATRRSQGRPIKELDAQLASIALSRDALLATRNIRDFEGCGVRLVNPWEA